MNGTASTLNVFAVHSRIVSNDLLYVFTVLNFVVLVTIISLFGIVTNVINIVIYFRLGFKETINISFFAMSISDLLLQIFTFLLCVCSNPWLRKALPETDIAYLITTIMYLLATRTTGWITAYVTFERCLCIFIPLKVKDIISPARAKIVNASIFILCSILVLPTYFVYELSSAFNPRYNRTVYFLTIIRSRRPFRNALYYINSIISTMVIFSIIVIFTIVLVVSINRTKKWRSQLSATKDTTTSSVKENKVVKMVISIAAIYIACYALMVGMFAYLVEDPEFTLFGRLRNLFLALTSFGLIMSSLNSSMNIFVYLKMSTKYREMFRALLCKK